MIQQEALLMMAKMGIAYANRINDVLQHEPDLAKLPDRQVAIAAMCYASAMAKLTDLDLEDLISLMCFVHQQVGIDLKEDHARPTRIAVMRRACIMEDEGREQFVSTFETRAEAEAWISSQKDEYFKPSDYYIVEEIGTTDAS